MRKRPTGDRDTEIARVSEAGEALAPWRMLLGKVQLPLGAVDCCQERKRRWSERRVLGPYAPGWRRCSSSQEGDGTSCGLALIARPASVLRRGRSRPAR